MYSFVFSDVEFLIVFIIFRRFGTKMDYSLVPKLTGTCKLNHISLQKYLKKNISPVGENWSDF